VECDAGAPRNSGGSPPRDIRPGHGAPSPVSALVQLDPDEGQPVSERTDVRILYDGEALHVGAWLHDSRPPTSRLVRRDSYVLDSDWLSIAIDSYHDHLSAYRFSVNPAGAGRDELFTSSGRTISSTSAVVTDWGGQADQSWDPVWSAATTTSDSGWVAEIRIPFSQLRFSEADRQTWGLQLERRIARKQEVALFAFTPKGQPSGVLARGVFQASSSKLPHVALCATARREVMQTYRVR
jgi:hypothetical protein